MTLAVVCLTVTPTSGRQTFRSAVEYVRLDVVVTDKHDRPVAGLTEDDFVVAEQGRPQTLATFEAVSIPTVRREITNVKATAPTIDVTSNSAPPLGRQWVMVIDDLHIIEQQFRKLQTLATEFIGRIPSNDQVAIVFVGRSDLSIGFTNDLGVLMRTVGRMRESLGFAYDANDSNGLHVGTAGGGATKSRTLANLSDPGNVMNATIDANQSERHRFGQATIDVLKNISSTLANSRYPRKALVYVSEGPTYDLNQTFSNNELDFNREAEFARDYFDEVAKAFTVARHAGVPVYTIDPRGTIDDTAVRGGLPTSPSQSNSAAPVLLGTQRQANNMRAIAENTGGLAFVGMSDVPRAVEALIHDNDIYYLLGFYPEPLVRDGKFHDVDVKIRNHPEYRVRARAGYTAPAATPPPIVDLSRAFAEAMAAALPDAGIALRVFAAPVAPGGNGMKTAITLQVTYPADAGKLTDTLDFAITALDGDGKVKASTRKSFEFTATPGRSGDATFAINDVIDLPTQPLALRVGVASHRLGTIGVIHTSLEAPRVTKDDAVLGGIVLGYAGPAREEAKPKGVLDGLVPFQPTTDRIFSTADTLRIFAPAFWKGAGSATVSLSIRQRDDAGAVRVLVERHDQLNPETTESATTTRAFAAAAATDSRASFMTSLPLKGVPAGNYVLAISVGASGRPAERAVAFSIK